LRNKVIIGSRGSELALWQTRYIKDKIQCAYPDLEIEVKIIKTTGDRLLDTSLSKIGDKGLFTKAIEDELLDKKIDLAVHSLKDLQTELPEGIILGAVSERENPSDVFISFKHSSIEALPESATVATGSLRRSAQMLNLRKDINIVDIRGNVNTRINKLIEKGWDGLILAYAGVHRLKLDDLITQIIPIEKMIPAVSQGVLGVEIREDDKELKEILLVIENKESRMCTNSEREFLKELQGGCLIPAGALARIEGDRFVIRGVISNLDGNVIIKEKLITCTDYPEKIGKELAEIILKKGGKEILDEIRKNQNRNELYGN